MQCFENFGGANAPPPGCAPVRSHFAVVYMDRK